MKLNLELAIAAQNWQTLPLLTIFGKSPLELLNGAKWSLSQQRGRVSVVPAIMRVLTVPYMPAA
jgi:hypothetical protein